MRPIRSLVWVDRKGHEEPIAAPLRAYGPPRLSPDGKRVATSIGDQENIEVWIWDFARETLRRLTFSPGVDSMPLWTPDGRRIIYMSARSGVPSLYSQAVDGSDVGGGTVDRLTTSANPQWPTSITRDGTRLFGFENGPKIEREIILVHLTDPTRPGINPSRPGRRSRACSAGTSQRFRRTVAISRTSRTNLDAWRSTCGRSRRWTVTVGRSRQEGPRAPCGRGAAESCSTWMNRVRSPWCRSARPGRRSSLAIPRRCSTPRMSSQIPLAITTCRLMVSGS